MQVEIQKSLATIEEEAVAAVTNIGRVASDEAESLLEDVRFSIDSKVKSLAGRLTNIVEQTSDSIGDDLAELLEKLGESLDGLTEKIASFNDSLQGEFNSLLTSTRETISEELSLLIDDIKDQLIGLVLFGVLLLTQAIGAAMGAYDFIRLNEKGGVLERGTFSVFVAILNFLFWAASFYGLVRGT